MTCSRLNQKEEFEPCKKFEPKDDKFTDIFCQNMIDELNEYPTLEPQNHDIRQCYEAIQSRNARIAELEAKQRWIPVEESLPEKGVDVLTGIYGYKYFWIGYLNNKSTFCGNGGKSLIGIDVWMPLPQPPDMLK